MHSIAAVSSSAALEMRAREALAGDCRRGAGRGREGPPAPFCSLCALGRAAQHDQSYRRSHGVTTPRLCCSPACGPAPRCAMFVPLRSSLSCFRPCVPLLRCCMHSAEDPALACVGGWLSSEHARARPKVAAPLSSRRLSSASLRSEYVRCRANTLHADPARSPGDRCSLLTRPT